MTDRPAHAAERRGIALAKRHKILTALLALVVLATPIWWSLGNALTNPSLGSSISARFAEWARDHGGAPVVNWVENVWYEHHQPPKGGKPPKGAIPAPTTTDPPDPSGPTTTTVPPVPHLALPPPIVPPASPALPGEGQWHPVGRLVNGLPALYEAFVRPDAVHTSLTVGIAWMDTKLLRATLYSGSYIPGGGPYTHSAPVNPSEAGDLVAAFNSGFRMQDANGGYYTDGKVIDTLRAGAASFVVYSDGHATVGQWGRDATMTPDVVSVRQNLDLVVDNGQPVPGLNANDNSKWGYTLHGNIYVWRSGVGVTADGALVYVGGPALNITTLADLLARAGAVRAMELDINTDWVSFASYDPAPGAPASGVNGTDLLSTMVGKPVRYFESWWSRDFITMSAVPPPPPPAPKVSSKVR